MAAFGAKYIKFAPIKTEPATGMPTYDTPVTLGDLVKAELTINLASGEIYGDDRLAEKLEEFSSGSIAVEVVDMTDTVESTLFGSAYDESTGLVDNTSDNIPYGGLGYCKVLVRNGKKVYRAIFYPKTKASQGTDSANTKGSSITFASTPVNFTVHEPNDGDWRHRKVFDTEAEAKAWIDKMFKGATE